MLLNPKFTDYKGCGYSHSTLNIAFFICDTTLGGNKVWVITLRTEHCFLHINSLIAEIFQSKYF